MNARHVIAAKFGLLRIQRALDQTMNHEAVVKSFKNCGMSLPYDPNYIFDRLFVKAKITNEDKEIYHAHLKEMVKIMMNEGEISDAYMDKIKFAMNTTYKDGLILSRRRTCILNNQYLVTHEEKKRLEKLEQEAAAAAKKKPRASRKRKASQPEPATTAPINFAPVDAVDPEKLKEVMIQETTIKMSLKKSAPTQVVEAADN